MCRLRLFATSFSILVCAGLMFIKPASALELVMFEQEACEWCEAWNKDIGVVYAKTTEGKRAPLRRVDIFDPTPKDLKKIPQGRFTPTFVLMDGGKEIGRIRGYPGEDFFWGLLDELLKKHQKLQNAAKKEKEQQNPA